MGRKENYFNAITTLSSSIIECDKFDDKIIINFITLVEFLNHILPDKFRNDLYWKNDLCNARIFT